MVKLWPKNYIIDRFYGFTFLWQTFEQILRNFAQSCDCMISTFRNSVKLVSWGATVFLASTSSNTFLRLNRVSNQPYAYGSPNIRYTHSHEQKVTPGLKISAPMTHGSRRSPERDGFICRRQYRGSHLSVNTSIMHLVYLEHYVQLVYSVNYVHSVHTVQFMYTLYNLYTLFNLYTLYTMLCELSVQSRV